MEQRFAKLESLADRAGDRVGSITGWLVKIEARLDEFTRHYATKVDCTEAKISIVVWTVTAVILA